MTLSDVEIVSFNEFIDSSISASQNHTRFSPLLVSSRVWHRRIPKEMMNWEKFTESVVDNRQSLPAELLASGQGGWRYHLISVHQGKSGIDRHLSCNSKESDSLGEFH